MRTTHVLLMLALLPGAPAAVLAAPAPADCNDGSCVPGGGPAKKDCFAEFGGTAKHLNQPYFDPAKPTKLPKRLVCFDGDPGCDVDGLVDQKCTFNVDVCLYNDDPTLSECTPATVNEVSAKAKKGDASALQAALGALALPAAASTCTAGATVVVPLKVTKKGAEKKTKGKVSVKAKTAGGTDSDSLQLTCLPREWPVHGYDRANTRASVAESQISTDNVDLLELKWQWEAGTAVTSTPTLGDKLVYVGDWNGVVHALNRKNGKEKWSFDTDSGPFGGIPGSITVLADGRVLVGTGTADVYALDGKKGTLLWKQSVGNLLVDHIWGSPVLANDKIFVGVASHSDNPCTQGRLVALDATDGTPLWEHTTVPDNVCDNETDLACDDDTDCGGGSCVAARGGGVTTTSALSPAGETVYTASVGCFTFPSVGNSDSIFSIDAATGDARWIHRTQSVEPFGDDEDPNTPPPYQDYGFLNGPILIDDVHQSAVVAAGKDGVLYARAMSDGGEVWENNVVDVMGGFASFGAFNGPAAYADGRLFTSLYGHASTLGDPALKQLQAFDVANDGVNLWESDPNTPTFAGVGVANGVVYLATGGLPGAFGVPAALSEFKAFDAETGATLATFPLPNQASSGPSIANGELFIGFGVLPVDPNEPGLPPGFSPGGLRVYHLK